MWGFTDDELRTGDGLRYAEEATIEYMKSTTRALGRQSPSGLRARLNRQLEEIASRHFQRAREEGPVTVARLRTLFTDVRNDVLALPDLVANERFLQSNPRYRHGLRRDSLADLAIEPPFQKGMILLARSGLVCLGPDMTGMISQYQAWRMALEKGESQVSAAGEPMLADDPVQHFRTYAFRRLLAQADRSLAGHGAFDSFADSMMRDDMLADAQTSPASRLRHMERRVTFFLEACRQNGMEPYAHFLPWIEAPQAEADTSSDTVSVQSDTVSVHLGGSPSGASVGAGTGRSGGTRLPLPELRTESWFLIKYLSEYYGQAYADVTEDSQRWRVCVSSGSISKDLRALKGMTDQKLAYVHRRWFLLNPVSVDLGSLSYAADEQERMDSLAHMWNDEASDSVPEEAGDNVSASQPERRRWVRSFLLDVDDDGFPVYSITAHDLEGMFLQTDTFSREVFGDRDIRSFRDLFSEQMNKIGYLKKVIGTRAVGVDDLVGHSREIIRGMGRDELKKVVNAFSRQFLREMETEQLVPDDSRAMADARALAEFYQGAFALLRDIAGKRSTPDVCMENLWTGQMRKGGLLWRNHIMEKGFLYWQAFRHHAEANERTQALLVLHAAMQELCRFQMPGEDLQIVAFKDNIVHESPRAATVTLPKSAGLQVNQKSLDGVSASHPNALAEQVEASLAAIRRIAGQLQLHVRGLALAEDCEAFVRWTMGTPHKAFWYRCWSKPLPNRNSVNQVDDALLATIFGTSNRQSPTIAAPRNSMSESEMKKFTTRLSVRISTLFLMDAATDVLDAPWPSEALAAIDPLLRGHMMLENTFTDRPLADGTRTRRPGFKTVYDLGGRSEETRRLRVDVEARLLLLRLFRTAPMPSYPAQVPPPATGVALPAWYYRVCYLHRLLQCAAVLPEPSFFERIHEKEADKAPLRNARMELQKRMQSITQSIAAREENDLFSQAEARESTHAAVVARLASFREKIVAWSERQPLPPTEERVSALARIQQHLRNVLIAVALYPDSMNALKKIETLLDSTEAELIEPMRKYETD